MRRTLQVIASPREAEPERAGSGAGDSVPRVAASGFSDALGEEGGSACENQDFCTSVEPPKQIEHMQRWAVAASRTGLRRAVINSSATAAARQMLGRGAPAPTSQPSRRGLEDFPQRRTTVYIARGYP